MNLSAAGGSPRRLTILSDQVLTLQLLIFKSRDIS